MAGCFFYLSRHPDAYKKVCEEVRATFASSDEIHMGSALNSCTYLRACIDESLRMSPPVGGALWREVCQGGVNIDGHTIPEGYDVGVGIYAIQHNPAYYPDPFRYLPERWIRDSGRDSEAVELARSAFSAFSIGPVGCLGKNLSYLEMMLSLAKVAWSLDIKHEVAARPKAQEASYLAKYPDHAKYEYRLRDRFTSWKAALEISFQARQDLVEGKSAG